MRIANDEIFSSPESMGVSFNSPAMQINHAEHMSIQLVFTGSPQGNFKLQISNDKGRTDGGEAVQETGITNWTDMTSSVINIGGAGSHVFNVQNMGFRWIRLVWTRTSSTGSLTDSRFNTKGVV